MHPQGADHFLEILQNVPEGALCVPCAAVRLQQDKWEVLKLVRGLIGRGHVLCEYRRCGSCHEQELVVRVRRGGGAPAE